jgi:amino acid adenylation domain-containing protein
MKISKFKLLDQEVEELSLILEKFNNTKTQYPHDKPIHALVDEMADSYPDKVAVTEDSGQQITYLELKKASNRVANLLRDHQLKLEEPVAVFFEPSVQMAIAIVGILKAGGAYVPLNESFPYERNKFILNDTKTRIILSSRSFIKELNKLQWECAELQTFICLDTTHVLEEDETANELMRKELWDYVGEEAEDDIAGGGWVNSYTGENLSREVMDEYGDNILKKLRPIVGKEDKVLEIGCSSGISMFRLAPLVKSYYGTDLSSEILKKTEKERDELGLDNITLNVCPAHEIEKIGEADFDLIIINSVVQCFNGHNYLRNVLKQAIELLSDKGKIFIGDIMDQDKKSALIDSLVKFKNENIGKGFTTKIDWSNEMFLSRVFFEDLKFDFPAIDQTSFTEKIGALKSELTDFRYDALLTIDKTKVNNKNKKKSRLKYQLDANDLEKYTDEPCKVKVSSNNLAYITYTSGTTGEPKGVMIEHKSVVRLIMNTNYISITPKDTIVHAAPLSFDASTFEIWGALLCGASVCTVKKDVLLDYAAFDKLLIKNKVTIGWLTSSLFNNIVDLYPNILVHYNTLLVGGDVLSVKHIQKALAFNENLTIINGYGPTENTTFSTTYKIDAQNIPEKIPIGKPIANSRAYILKENNLSQILPVGIEGELCVAGDGLARGYWGDSKLTEEKFQSHEATKEERLYRTGDRAKWLPDGTIQFIGRLDEQIKIRGHRIELKEIEHQLLALPEVKEAIVLVKEGVSSEKQLSAYVVTKEEKIQLDDIIGRLSQFLPEYMLPSQWMILDEMPLNDNGKIDKKALPDILEKELNEKKKGPRNEREETIARIWKEILGLRTISIHDNFFAVGGHSLKATQVMSKILEELDVKISIRELFTFPTIAGISNLIAEKNRFEKSRIERIPEANHYELSHAQHRLWVQDQLGKGQIAFNVPGMYYLKSIDREALSKAFASLVDRHEILRTTFVTIDETPKQLIHESADFPFELEFEDLRAQALSQEQIEAIAQKEAQTPFQLDKGPLIRARLLQLTNDDYALLYTMHHIICDGWSMGVMVHELMALYASVLKERQNPLPPLKIQYKDYAHWQREQLRGDTLKEHKQYWTNKLKDLPLALELPTDFTRPEIQSFEGRMYSFDLDKKTAQQLQALCNQHQVTLFMAFFALVRVLLYKYTGQTDMTIGTTVSGRVHQDLDNLIGFFVNMIVIRGEAHPDMNFDNYLNQTKEELLEAYDHQVYPFDKIIADLGVPRNISRNPLFDVLVAVDINSGPGGENAQQHQKDDYDAIKNAEINFEVGSKFDLMFRLIKTGEAAMEIQLSYNSNLFKEDSIVLLKERLTRLIRDAVNHPQKKNDALEYNILQDNKLDKAKTSFNF